MTFSSEQCHIVSVGVTERPQFLWWSLVVCCWTLMTWCNQRLSFLDVCLPRTVPILLFLLLLSNSKSTGLSAAGFDGWLEATSEPFPAYPKPARDGWVSSRSTTRAGMVGLAVAGIGHLCLSEVLGGGVVDSVMWTDRSWQPLAHHVPLNVVEACNEW